MLTFHIEITYISTEDPACEQTHSERCDTCYSMQVCWSIFGATINRTMLYSQNQHCTKGLHNKLNMVMNASIQIV